MDSARFAKSHNPLRLHMPPTHSPLCKRREPGVVQLGPPPWALGAIYFFLDTDTLGCAEYSCAQGWLRAAASRLMPGRECLPHRTTTGQLVV